MLHNGFISSASCSSPLPLCPLMLSADEQLAQSCKNP